MKPEGKTTDVTHIVHVTEAFASGTLEAIRRLVEAQSELGPVISVVHSVRADSPPESARDFLFPSKINRLQVRSEGRLFELWELATTARKLLKDDPRSVVHVHSSFAAGVLRLRMLFQPENRRILYSPHGFAFLREDIPSIARKSILWLEKFLARHCGGLVLVSQSEADLARSWPCVENIDVVENAVDLSLMPSIPTCLSASESRNGLPTVVTMGRVTFQKAPWKFAALARELEGRANFVWIGDGADADRSRWLDGSPVSVTGWLSREDVTNQLKSASLFVLPSLWEGMPLALIEAQCLGLPSVASRIVGNCDVVLDGVSGYLVDTAEDLNLRVGRLLDEPALRESMARAAIAQRDRFDKDRLGGETLTIYDRLLSNASLAARSL